MMIYQRKYRLLPAALMSSPLILVSLLHWSCISILGTMCCEGWCTFKSILRMK